MKIRVQAGLKTDPGRQRPANEDTIGEPGALPPDMPEQKGWLYVVADGMGGHVAGKLASETAVRAAVDEYYRDPFVPLADSLLAAAARANDAVRAHAQEPGRRGMGTTLVAAALQDGELYVANVGDSRAYLLRSGQIRQLTRDHSWVEEQHRAGVLSAEEARRHPYKNVITRALGAQPQVEVDLFRERLHGGDVVLLCSDGLWGEVTDEEILSLALGLDPQAAADALVALANERGAGDNVSVVVLKVRRVRQPLPRRLALVLVLAIATAALLALLPRFLTPALPVEEAPRGGPLCSQTAAGDEPSASAIGVTSSTGVSATQATSGQAVLGASGHLQPESCGLFVSGRVRGPASRTAEGYILQIENTGGEYLVNCRSAGARITGKLPGPGSIVTVFGYTAGGSSPPAALDAALVDVARYDPRRSLFSFAWHNWYLAYGGEEVWVCTARSRFTVDDTQRPPGQAQLCRGVFLPYGDLPYRGNYYLHVVESYAWDDVHACYVRTGS